MKEKDRKFHEIEHTADIGIRVWGTSYEELFENAFRGIMEIITDENTGANDVKFLHISSLNRETLLVDFLNEILYLINSEGWLPADVKVRIYENELDAELSGSGIKSKDAVEVEVKSATYHKLKIEEKDGKFETAIYFDV